MTDVYETRRRIKKITLKDYTQHDFIYGFSVQGHVRKDF